MNELNLATILSFSDSPAVERLISAIHRPTMLKVLGKNHSENCHSSMLGWIFSNRDFLNLPTPPPMLLLRLIRTKVSERRLCEDKQSVPYFDAEIEEVYVSKEKSLTNKGRIDLLIEITLKIGTTIRIWIENKMFSPLDDNQLSRYHDNITSKPTEESVIDLFVFLSSDIERHPNNDAYIHITYQQLYDEVLWPIYQEISVQENSESRDLLHHYLDSLTSYSHTCSPIVKSRQQRVERLTTSLPR